MSIAKIEDIERLCLAVKDNWALCHFTGQCESEVMVVQTIHAAKSNHEKHGECFSLLDENAKRGRQNCGTDNAHGLKILFDRGFLVKGEWEGKEVVLPTQALVDAIDAHLEAEE